jgi:hypothetical protein
MLPATHETQSNERHEIDIVCSYTYIYSGLGNYTIGIKLDSPFSGAISSETKCCLLQYVVATIIHCPLCPSAPLSLLEIHQSAQDLQDLLGKKLSFHHRYLLLEGIIKRRTDFHRASITDYET